MTWTGVITDIILFTFVTLTGFVVKKYVLPWIETNHLMEAATVAVQAAQAIFGRYNGEAKLQAALEQLKNDGWDIESEKVMNALRAAWQNLNLMQIESGVKEPPHVD